MVMKLDQLVNGAINVGFGAAAVAALPEAEVSAELARANEEFAERVRVETDALLGKVLYTTSCAMKNSFAMNDNVR